MQDGPIAFETDAEFPRVDGRDYIQGITILTRMLDTVLDAGKTEAISVRRIKYTHLTLCNGTIRGTIGNADAMDLTGAAAFLTASLDDAPVQAAYFPDPERQTTVETVSPPYPIDAFAPTKRYGARMTIEAPDGAEFLWTLIEANKRTIAHWVKGRITAPRIELVEAMNFVYRRDAMAKPGPIIIETLSERAFGDRLFVLNEVHYSAADGSPSSVRLNYSVHETAAS